MRPDHAGAGFAVHEIPPIFDDIAIRVKRFGPVKTECLSGYADVVRPGVGNGFMIHNHCGFIISLSADGS